MGKQDLIYPPTLDDHQKTGMNMWTAVFQTVYTKQHRTTILMEEKPGKQALQLPWLSA